MKYRDTVHTNFSDMRSPQTCYMHKDWDDHAGAHLDMRF